MRAVPSAMREALEAGAATLCTCWILTRADGVRLGFTDHDRPLAIEGVVCLADSGWTGGAAGGRAGLEPGLASASGVLDAATIDAGDLKAGLYDQAGVETWRVDWSAPEVRLKLRTETIARTVRDGGVFILELQGALAALDRTVGRTYGVDCDALLGDARCGLGPDEIAGRTCDKRFETCHRTFGNTDNFRGFPDIPGDDVLTLYPADGERVDGGSRR